MRRIHSLDYLKTFLSLFVVLAHTNWIQNNTTMGLFVFGSGLMRTLVPLFCIIAGYFLHISMVGGRAGKWLMRMLVLYLFWMAVYFPIWQGQVTGLRSLATTLLWGFFHLWFLIGLFVGGLALAGLVALGRRLAPGHEVWFVVLPAAICALLGLAMQYADLSGLAQIPVQRYRNGLFMCFPFLAIGYLLNARLNRPGTVPATRPRPLLILGLALLLLCAEAWLVQARFGTGVMIEMPAATYVAAPLIFLLALELRMPPQPVDLGLVSATIYFLHVWAFRLADLLDIHDVLGLMLFGVGVPTVIALFYDEARRRMRGGPHSAALVRSAGRD
ncbi:MAG: acyltransferase family protein [Paracoccus sp. (in: a-proteobacteria)]|uniref:acyltransferase family protein n=1 Tax=Paracoccus sp. TaxID=267 RepID=UPI0039E380FC